MKITALTARTALVTAAFAIPAIAGTLLLPRFAVASPWWMRGIQSNETDFLPPDVAFRVYSRTDGEVLRVRWVIADGYYLYRQKMSITAESPDLSVAAPLFPPGILKQDPYLGTQEIYTREVEATAAYHRIDAGAHPLQITVSYQGCASAGLCYPPITKVISPASFSSVVRPVSQRWEAYAILGGGAAFVLAGLVLRKGRRLAVPA
jgi:thiol:disulfide interchange protein DsbD